MGNTQDGQHAGNRGGSPSSRATLLSELQPGQAFCTNCTEGWDFQGRQWRRWCRKAALARGIPARHRQPAANQGGGPSSTRLHFPWSPCCGRRLRGVAQQVLQGVLCPDRSDHCRVRGGNCCEAGAGSRCEAGGGGRKHLISGRHIDPTQTACFQGLMTRPPCHPASRQQPPGSSPCRMHMQPGWMLGCWATGRVACRPAMQPLLLPTSM